MCYSFLFPVLLLLLLQIIQWCWYNPQIPSVTSVCAAALNAAAQLSRMPLRLAHDVQAWLKGSTLLLILGSHTQTPLAGCALAPRALSTPQLTAPGGSAQANTHFGLFYAHKLIPSFNKTPKNTQPRISVIKCTLRTMKLICYMCWFIWLIYNFITKQNFRVQRNIFIYKWNKSPRSLKRSVYDFHSIHLAAMCS